MFKKFQLKDGDDSVEKFELKEFSLRPTVEATKFEKSELISKKDFVIDQSSSKKSGLSYLKDKRIENEINEQVSVRLDKVKSEIFDKFKEKGFKEGYSAGAEEGKKSVLEKFESEVQNSIMNLNLISQQLEHEKNNLIKKNKEDIINLIKLSCEKFCLKQINFDETVIENLIEQSLKENTNEENYNFLLSKNDFENLSGFKDNLKDKVLPAKVTFEVSSEVNDGGAVLELNNGRVNKTIEVRFNKIWEALGL